MLSIHPMTGRRVSKNILKEDRGEEKHTESSQDTKRDEGGVPIDLHSRLGTQEGSPQYRENDELPFRLWEIGDGETTEDLAK